MAFYVSRQRDTATGRLFVEIAIGGSKKSGPDPLTNKYNGEGKNLVSPKDAVMVSERIFKQWERDYADESKALCITDGTARSIIAFDIEGMKYANLWADKALADLEKCGACTKPMGNRAAFETEHIPTQVFCSEVCVSKRYRDMFNAELPTVAAGKKTKKSPF
jgi:hypothetical protein